MYITASAMKKLPLPPKKDIFYNNFILPYYTATTFHCIVKR
jgi:hypothetical protein